MAQRHRDAIGIQNGACNPRAIINILHKAKEEIVSEGGVIADIRNDPAVRLIVHQLAFIVGLTVDHPQYDRDMDACEKLAK